VDDNLWTEAQEELLNINSFKTPRDKLRCILSCCKRLFDTLRKVFGPDKTPGVDDFIPIFIFIILHSNPPCLHSNIQYLSHFRHPSRMMAESGYYFVSFLTAVSFIETLDSSVLSIDPEEFNELIKGEKRHEKKQLIEDSLDLDPIDKQVGDWVWIQRKGPAIYLSEKKLFTHLLSNFLTKQNPKRLLEKMPEDLSKEEIWEMFQDYKRLVLLEESGKLGK